MMKSLCSERRSSACYVPIVYDAPAVSHHIFANASLADVTAEF